MGTKINLAAFLLLTVFAFAQNPPVAAKPGDSRSTTSTNAANGKPLYLTVPFDLGASNLGPGFAGHDIVAVYKAMKKPAKITPKGEFETSAQYEARTAEFAKKPIFGSVSPNDYFAFVLPREMVSGSRPMLVSYDADLRILEEDFRAQYADFSGDADQARRVRIALRETREKNNYPDSKPGDSHGVIYSLSLPNGWPFVAGQSELAFSHLLDIGPEEAKSLKPDLQALIVCRLSAPWTRWMVFGSDELFDSSYLEVVPEQLWLYNARTGEVLEKISEDATPKQKARQFALQMRQTPLILEFSGDSDTIAFITLDGVAQRRKQFEKGRPLKFAAKKEIVVMVSKPRFSDMEFRLNGKHYNPVWRESTYLVGSQEVVDTATAVITLPSN